MPVFMMMSMDKHVEPTFSRNLLHDVRNHSF